MTPNPDTATPGSSGFGRSVAGGTVRLGAAVLRPATGVGLAALDALLASRFAREAVDRVIASALPQRAVNQLLEGPLVEATIREMIRLRVVEQLADRLIAEGVAEHVANRLLEGPELRRVVEALLESDELWLVVDEVAHSPSVTAAITQQSASFADEVAGRVRASTRSADAWLETRARRALRRKAAPETGG